MTVFFEKDIEASTTAVVFNHYKLSLKWAYINFGR